MSTSQSIVIHVTSGESADFETALRNLVNLVQEESVSTPPEKMQVVVNGRAVRFLLATAPEAAKITQMADAGVGIGACANSLDRFGHDSQDLAEGVTTIPSGVAEVARAQQHGATYLKLP
ncbi:DsrE family protein [Halorientalis marina]|jgi:intracellular sulfur oxidation DsrE/DsrF family protein|uniref:DsrE family protein n=1 Tax=Halorientalis marina TaxID=2931976 RepID=UPI001FF5A3A9|nr:DsrE family protein [Halorientalis marina]